MTDSISISDRYGMSDEDMEKIADFDSATEKASPVSADLLLIEDSEASNAKKKVQIGNLQSISEANATDLTDGGDSTLHYHAADRSRANHTGTQAASTISDFASTVQATKLDDLAAPDDNTDLNATDSYHGLLPKLPGAGFESYILYGDGNWGAQASHNDIVTFDNLNNNGDIGPGASQVPAGDHTHTDLLSKSGGTMTGEINCADNLITRPLLKDVAETVQALGNITGTEAIDLTAGNVAYATVTGNVTISITNPPSSGNAGFLTLFLYDGGDYTITWPTGTDWDGDEAPNLQSNDWDCIVFVTLDAGTTWRAVRTWKAA